MVDLAESRGTIPFEDKKITFYETGKAKDNNTVILIHGTGGTTFSHYYNILPMLSVHQKVLSIDLMNKEEGILDLEHYYQQVKLLIDSLSPNEMVTLVGYSLGAIVAAYTASKLNKKVTKLVMLCGWFKTTSTQKFYHSIVEKLFNEKSAALSDFVTINAFSENYLSQLSNQQINKISKFITITPDFIRQNDLNNTVDLSDFVDRITAKTLVISCTEDKLVPVSQGKLLFASIENSRLALIKAGHVVNAEAFPQVVQLINNFNKNYDFYPKNLVIKSIQP